jgi:formylglycine-generating enzyme required for sulfatase activity/class 3 adenylate cyclase
MTEGNVERRLSAILAADIAGYSALMGADEARTVRDLKRHQAAVLPMVGEFAGRIIDTAGDGFLVEFSSVVNAVTCAVAIQSKMAERNAGIEPECRMQFRIGINIGEVMVDGARIFGDGINVAARLEGLADPGGISISSKVYEEISGRIDLACQDLGEQKLKNIARPVRVFRVRLDRAAGAGRPHGPEAAGLDARYFAWPPQSDRNRSPYRGLRPLEAVDAGIFFGRGGQILEALDRLRGLREAAPPRLLVILGASGAGKSSFLRAGLFPRIARDDGNFLPLPIIRPERAAISGETGLLSALEGAFAAARITITRADLRVAIQGGAAKLKPLLQALAEKATPVALATETKLKPPALILSVDQGEELFVAEAKDEAHPFLVLLRDLLNDDVPAVIAVFTIRSDKYERLQLSRELESVHQEVLSLPPIPTGAYAEVIKGPARRLEGTERALAIEDALVDALLTDIEAGDAKDALPLLAFTLERLYDDYHAGGHLRLSHYDAIGRVKGSIEAAVERAFKAADADPAIPRDRVARLALLRRGLIPWLAGIDPDTGAPRSRVARLSEIPTEARPLLQHLVEQRLLATDVTTDTGEPIVEPAHEALLRQWSLLQGYLIEDAGLLAVLEGVKRASRDWGANDRGAAWLTHVTDRLAAAERLTVRPDLAANLEPTDREYLSACRNAEAIARGRKRRVQAFIYVLLVGMIAGLLAWINQGYIKEQWSWFTTIRPYMLTQVRPHVLSVEAEQALKPLQSFRECAQDCPEMVVVPAGAFMMGSPATERGRYGNEGPQHRVTIARPFAVSKFDVTFADWDACVSIGGCPKLSDLSFGRNTKPLINVTFTDSQKYVAWLAKMTGRPYRLLTEAEWEYAARAGTATPYYWGEAIGEGNANCVRCGTAWDTVETSPVGSFASNAFGLYDMAGNVWQWVQDCYHGDYDGAPTDGSLWTGGDCSRRIVRGGSWLIEPEFLRSAFRVGGTTDDRNTDLGFRVARTLAP